MAASLLLSIARESILEVFQARSTINKEVLYQTHPILKEKIACFIHIYLDEKLFSFFGTPIPDSSLLDNLIVNAKKAAFDNQSSSILKSSNYSDVIIELSLISALEELETSDTQQLINTINFEKEGLMLNYEDKTVTIMPQEIKRYEHIEDFFSQLQQLLDHTQENLQLFRFRIESEKEQSPTKQENLIYE